MVFEIKYHLLLPKQERLFDENELSFTINHIKSRQPSVLYFILHLFDVDGNEIYLNGSTVTQSTNDLTDGYTESSKESECAFVSPRKAIGTVFSQEGKDFTHNFNIVDALIESSTYMQLELVTMGVTSENPLYFSEMMFQEGEFSQFHEPSELLNYHKIELPSNTYVNLYDKDGNYLQVIRPNQEEFSTASLDGAKYSILAPHFDDDKDVDDHTAVFLEAMNQTEQTIDVLR